MTSRLERDLFDAVMISILEHSDDLLKLSLDLINLQKDVLNAYWKIYDDPAVELVKLIHGLENITAIMRT